MKSRNCFYPILAIIPILLYSLEFGYQKRNWYVGGDFSRVRNSDGEYVQASIISKYDGLNWDSFGDVNETDGEVRSVYVDTCLNVYIGGTFSKVSGIETGPLAWKRYGDEEFQPFGSLSFQSSPSPVINSISIDCKNIPTMLQKCGCDVYIGGKFSMTTFDSNNENVTAINVARYDSFYEDEEEDDVNVPNAGWSALGGYASHGMTTNDHEVYVVNKKNFGIQITSNQLFVGGNIPGGFQHIDLEEKNLEGENKFEKPVEYMFGFVNDFYYDPLRFSNSEVVVAGSMNFEYEENINCTNLCIYDVVEKTWEVVDPEFVTTTIYRVDKNAQYLIVGGDNFLKKYKRSNGEWFDLISPELDYLNVTTANSVRDFYICKNTDPGCSSDSIGVVTGSGDAWFWNEQKKVWIDFGLGLSGNAISIGSLYNYYGDD